MSNIITVRDSEIVAAEINTIKEDTRRVMIANAIRIGEKLTEAKSLVPFGEWGKWLEEKVDYSQSTAEDLMKLYREYGSNQQSLFDSWTKSETFGKLSYSKHLALLALPFAVRQEFAETHDVENMSTRELQDAIRERDNEKAAKEAAEHELLEEQNANAELKQDLQAAQSQIESIEERLLDETNRAQVAQKELDQANQRADQLQEQLEKAKKKAKEAKDALTKAKENPEIPEAVMEQMRKEVEAEAAAKATEELQKKLEAALADADNAKKAQAAAEQTVKDTEEKLAAAQKAAKMQNPDVAVFQSLYIQLQETWNRAVGAFNKVRQSDESSAVNCLRAMEAAIDKFKSDIAVKQ